MGKKAKRSKSENQTKLDLKRELESTKAAFQKTCEDLAECALALHVMESKPGMDLIKIGIQRLIVEIKSATKTKIQILISKVKSLIK